MQNHHMTVDQMKVKDTSYHVTLADHTKTYMYNLTSNTYVTLR